MTDSDCRSWFSTADLLTADASAPIALIGAPMGLGSITPGRCDLAPETVRAAMKRMSVYDLETQTDLLGLTITETQPITGITGASSQFMTHRRYFFNLGTRSAAMQPAVIPQANTGALRPVN